jgi:hypothetical protein
VVAASSNPTTKTSAAAKTAAAQPKHISEQSEVAIMTQNTDAPDPTSLEAATAPVDTRDMNTRFRIFVVDSGWNHPASKVLEENIELIHALTHEDPIYILDRDKSIALLRKNKDLIGHDPIIAVHDVTASVNGKRVGFRLHLGLQDDEAQCLASLKMFARFINTHRNAKDLEADVRRELHREGLAGAIEIVGGAAQSVLLEG